MIEMITELLDAIRDLLIECWSKVILIGCIIVFVGTLSVMLIAIGKYDFGSIVMSLIMALLISLFFCVIAGIIHKIIHWNK